LQVFLINVFQRLYVGLYAIHIYASITPWDQYSLEPKAFCVCTLFFLHAFISRLVCMHTLEGTVYVTQTIKMSRISGNYIVGKTAKYDQKSFLLIFRFWWKWA